MASYFLFNGSRPGMGRGLRMAAILSTAVLCGCSRGEGEAAPGEEARVDTPGSAPADSPGTGTVLGATVEMAAALRRSKELGERLRKHREELVASNPEMAEVWKTGLGNDEEARAAQQKIKAFFHADAKGMEMEEALVAAGKALREAQDKMIEKATGEGMPARFDPQASTGYESGRSMPGRGPRSPRDVLQTRKR